MSHIKDIADMLEELATQHGSIGADNFGRTLEEYQAKSRSITAYAMIMEPITGRLHGQSEAQIYRTYNVGFSIVHPWQIDRFDDQWIFMEACENIALQILARIRYYSAEYNRNTPEVWQGFDIFTVRIEPIFIELDQMAGVSVNFELNANVSMRFDPTDVAGIWADLP